MKDIVKKKGAKHQGKEFQKIERTKTLQKKNLYLKLNVSNR